MCGKNKPLLILYDLPHKTCLSLHFSNLFCGISVDKNYSALTFMDILFETAVHEIACLRINYSSLLHDKINNLTITNVHIYIIYGGVREFCPIWHSIENY